MAHGHSGIAAQLFEYLRHQQHLCSLSSYKAWVSHLVLQASMEEEEQFGAVAGVIDHVAALLLQGQDNKGDMRGKRARTRGSDSRPRLLAEHLLMQAANAGCEVDEETERRLRKYSPHS